MQKEVVARAEGRCEYCHFPEIAAELPFHVDHITAEQHGGATEPGNLAWACFNCNLRKGPNIAAIDPTSGQMSRLFHPRTDTWTEHFAFDGPKLTGLTPVGRATVAVLDANDDESIAVRRALMLEGVYEW